VEEFMQQMKDFSLILDWPPFTTSLKKREEFKEDVQKETKRILSLANAKEENAYDRMYSTVNAKWADDLDEARLYQKRYADNPEEAQKAVLKLEGRDNVDPMDDGDIPLGVF
jgi:hypothetical protein